MAFSVKNASTEIAVRRLAKLKNKSLTVTIHEAVENEYHRLKQALPLTERLGALAERYAQYPETGFKADKAFFDDLSGDASYLHPAITQSLS